MACALSARCAAGGVAPAACCTEAAVGVCACGLLACVPPLASRQRHTGVTLVPHLAPPPGGTLAPARHRLGSPSWLKMRRGGGISPLRIRLFRPFSHVRRMNRDRTADQEMKPQESRQKEARFSQLSCFLQNAVLVGHVILLLICKSRLT